MHLTAGFCVRRKIFSAYCNDSNDNYIFIIYCFGCLQQCKQLRLKLNLSMAAS